MVWGPSRALGEEYREGWLHTALESFKQRAEEFGIYPRDTSKSLMG